MISLTMLIHAVLLLVVGGLIVWLCWWFVGYVGLPEPFAKIARVVIGLVALLICVGVLLSLLGYQLFSP